MSMQHAMSPRQRRAQRWLVLSLVCGACASDGSSDTPAAGSGGNSHQHHGPPVGAPVPPPVLTHSPIDLEGSFDASTGALGALRCSPAAPPAMGGAAGAPAAMGGAAGASAAMAGEAGAPQAEPCVQAFDAAASDGEVGVGFLGFVTEPGASVFAAGAGIVTDVLEHAGETGVVYEVRLKLAEDAHFWLEYTNLAEPAVSVGQALDAGAVLGTAGPGTAGRAKLGLALVRDEQVYQRLCPVRYADPALSERFEAARVASGIAELCSTTSLTCSGVPCAEPRVFHELGGDVDQGRAIYRQTCATCHGATGQSMHGCDPFCWHSAVVSKIIGYEMPPQGDKCVDSCADDVAAYLLHEIFPGHQH